jgi:hypothetical protein
MRFWGRTEWILSLFVLVFIILYYMSCIELPVASIYAPTGNVLKTQLPYMDEHPSKNSDYILIFRLNANWLTPSVYKLTAYDSIQEIHVNGNVIPLDHALIAGDLKNHHLGIHINLGQYLHPGINMIQIRVHSSHLRIGLNLERSGLDFTTALIATALALSFLLLLGLILKRTELTKGAVWILLGSLAVRFLYLYYTGPFERQHDIGGHIEYILYLVRDHALPASSACWQCYQPPLYYILASFIYSIFSPLRGYLALRELQMFSVLLSFVFLLISHGIIRRVFPRKEKLQHLTLGLIAFWPSLVIHSARISNDVLFYPVVIASVYFLVKWDDDRRFQTLLSAFMLAIVSMMVKTNGLIVIGTIGLVFGINWFIHFLHNGFRRENIQIFLKQSAALITILVVTFGILFSEPILDNLHGKKTPFIIGNIAGLDDATKVERNWRNFAYLNLPAYLTYSYTSPWIDQGGRQYFWNYLLKTSLFGEWDNYQGTKFIAWLLSLGLIGLILLAGSGIVLSLAQGKWDHRLNGLLILSVFFLMALISMRYIYSYACIGDFRFILPIIVPFVLLTASGFDQLDSMGRCGFRSANKLMRAVHVFMWSFIILSILHSVVPILYWRSFASPDLG